MLLFPIYLIDLLNLPWEAYDGGTHIRSLALARTSESAKFKVLLLILLLYLSISLVKIYRMRACLLLKVYKIYGVYRQ